LLTFNRFAVDIFGMVNKIRERLPWLVGTRLPFPRNGEDEDSKVYPFFLKHLLQKWVRHSLANRTFGLMFFYHKYIYGLSKSWTGLGFHDGKGLVFHWFGKLYSFLYPTFAIISNSK